MVGGKYLLLMLVMAAILSISTGHRNSDSENTDDSDEDDRSDDRSDDDGDGDDDSDDDGDDDSGEDGSDEDKSTCPGETKNHVCCNYVDHVITVCYKQRVYYVTIQVCFKVCCEGWVKDEYGRCTVPAAPEIQCENGGTPDPDGNAYCLCTSDFTGRQCETAVCTPRCDNGGECIAENGHSSCLCTEGFTGTRCDQPVCPEMCQNGGSCVSQGYYAACECPHGFSGAACEHKVRPGTCPSIRDIGDPRDSQSRCVFDDNCPDSDKCCPSQYGKFCVTPGTPTCLYNGKHYKEGEEFSRSSCEKCTCIRPSILHHTDDEFACYTIDCPPISCPDYTYPTDMCCPVCAGTLPREPQISDCPTQAVDVAVQPDRNIISVAERFKSIKARDHKMEVLKVKFSHAYLSSCACNYTELDIQHISVVSEPDAYGRVAYCSFTVKVVDVHSPKFSRCPSMISAFTDQKILWRAPSASDNVGVREINLRSKYANNTMFPEGKHYVEYFAKDFHENVAVCRIPVSVYHRDTTDPSLPIGMRLSSTDRNKHNMYIGVGVGGAVLLILVLLGLLYCRHLRTPAPEQTLPVKGKTSEAFDNGIYSEGVSPPPYDNIAFKGDKSGPPPYKPVTPPPVYRASSTTSDYASIAVPSVTSGVDNQMYMDGSLYHSIQALSPLSDKGSLGEKSPPPSYRGVPASPNSHYAELDVKSVDNQAFYDQPNQEKSS